MPEAIITTREYDGTCTVRVGRSLILSSLSRAAADQFVVTYRRLSAPAPTDLAETRASTGGRPGQVVHKSPSAPGGITGIERKRG